MKRPFVILLASLLGLGTANAATCTWTGGSGNWGDAANWKNGQNPTEGDTVELAPRASGVEIVNDMGALALAQIRFQTANALRLSSAEAITLTGETPLAFESGGAYTNAASLVFAQDDAKLAFAGAARTVWLAGAMSGSNVFYSAQNSTQTKVVLAGANDFTGRMKWAMCSLTVKNAAALGCSDGAILESTGGSGTLSFNAAGDYRVNLLFTDANNQVNFYQDVNLYGWWTNRASGLQKIYVDWSRNVHVWGEVTKPNGYLYPGLMGDVQSGAKLHLHGPVKILGFINGSFLSGINGATTLYSSQNEIRNYIGLGYSMNVRCAGANVLGGGYVNWYEYNGTGMLDLNGFDQTANRLHEESFALRGTTRYITNSSATPATLTLRGTQDDCAACRIEKAVTLVWNPTGDYTQTITGRVNTMTGDLVVSNGTLRIPGNTTFANVARIVVGPRGTLDLSTTTAGAFAGLKSIAVDGTLMASNAVAPFADDAVTLRIGACAAVALSGDVRVQSVYVKGTALRGGTYTSDGADGTIKAPWLSGSGKLTVPKQGLMMLFREVDPNAELAFASDGQTPYALVTPETLQTGERFVLDDFKALFKQATGADIPEVTLADAPATNRIFFGLTDGAGWAMANLGDQEYVVARRGRDVYLVGGGANGNRLAVYDFLERSLGFRFFDARGGMRVPSLARGEKVRIVERRRFPSFKYRYMNGGTGYYNRPTSSLFIYRNGQNSFVSTDAALDNITLTPDDFRLVGEHAHMLPYYIPPYRTSPTFAFIRASETNDLFVVHPEYFSADASGNRTDAHQVCYSQPGLRKLLAERLMENMRLHPNGNIYDFSARDTTGPYCSCADCTALTAKYGTPAGPLVDFVLEYGPQINAAYPQNRMMCLSYRKNQTQCPPTNGVTRFAANYMPDFAPIDDNFARDWTDASNASTYEDLKTWCRLANDVTVWYYPNPYGGAVTPPLGTVARVANDLKLMYRAGVNGHLMEHNVGVGLMLGFTELQSYIIIHLMREVGLNWLVLADEFIEHQYGAAAAAFKAYWLEVEAASQSVPLFLSWNASPVSYQHLTPERLLKWEDDFDAMEELVKDDAERLFNVRRVRVNLDYGLMTHYAQVLKTDDARLQSFDFYRARATEIVEQAVREFSTGRIASRGKSDFKSFTNELAACAIQARIAQIPLPEEIFGSIPKERLNVFLPSVLAHSLVADEDAACGLAAWFDNNGRTGVGLPFYADFEDHTKSPPNHYTRGIGAVTKATIGPRGEYSFYRLGSHVVSQDCTFRMGAGDSWDIKAGVGTTWRQNSKNRVTFYASLKFEGPAFYAEDAGKSNKVFCDRVVAVTEGE